MNTEDDTAAKLKGATHLIKFINGEELYVDANINWKDTASMMQIHKVMLPRVQLEENSAKSIKPIIHESEHGVKVLTIGGHIINILQIMYIKEIK